MYAIIDVETTGGSPATDRVIEIAVILYDGSTVIDKFSTLINPRRPIDPYVTKLTGIRDEMVQDAPSFEEIHQKILELTHEAIFVAHNVKFDFGMLRQEFKRLRIDFNRRLLDTVTLARKTLPGFDSYSLGNICDSLGIQIENRHRALGDAEATVLLLEKILTKEASARYIDIELNHGIDVELLPPYISKAEIEKLPDDAGVYYYRDELGRVIYLEGAKSIRKKVITHLNSDAVTPERKRMYELMRSIDYELSGNELIAKLQAHSEQKLHQPEFNKKVKIQSYTHGIFLSADEQGFKQMKIHPINWEQDELVLRCTSKASANKILTRIIKENNLYSWFALRSRMKDKGIDQKSLKSYNQQLEKAVRRFLYKQPNFFILAQGIHPDQFGVVWVHQNEYRGFGFFDPVFQPPTPENLREVIKSHDDDSEVQKTIRNFLRKSKNIKMVTYTDLA